MAVGLGSVVSLSVRFAGGFGGGGVNSRGRRLAFDVSAVAGRTKTAATRRRIS